MDRSLFIIYPLVDVECVLYAIKYVKFKNHNDNYKERKNNVEKVTDRLNKCRKQVKVAFRYTELESWVGIVHR